jgi:Mrp family chromosome partitioning ATPase
VSRIYDALQKSQAGRGAPRDASETTRVPSAGEGPPPSPPVAQVAEGRPDEPTFVTLPALQDYPERFWTSVSRVAAAIQAGPKRQSRRVLFIGADAQAGTTTLALATCCLLVRDPGVETLLIDAHARQEGRRLLPNGRRGLIQVAVGEVTPAEAIAATDRRGLGYLPRGPGSYNGPKLFEKLVPIMSSLYARFDYIILDAPPVVTAPESAQLAGFCDGVVVVLASERTPKTEAARTKEILDQHKANILGTVINRARKSSLIGYR